MTYNESAKRHIQKFLDRVFVLTGERFVPYPVGRGIHFESENACVFYFNTEILAGFLDADELASQYAEAKRRNEAVR